MIVLKSTLKGVLKDIYLLGALEAEKLTKQKWKQYCGTPCILIIRTR